MLMKNSKQSIYIDELSTGDITNRYKQVCRSYIIPEDGGMHGICMRTSSGLVFPVCYVTRSGFLQF